MQLSPLKRFGCRCFKWATHRRAAYRSACSFECPSTLGQNCLKFVLELTDAVRLFLEVCARSGPRLIWKKNPRWLMVWMAPASHSVAMRRSAGVDICKGAIAMQVTTIGLDLAKNVFRAHGIAEDDTMFVT